MAEASKIITIIPIIVGSLGCVKSNLDKAKFPKPEESNAVCTQLRNASAILAVTNLFSLEALKDLSIEVECRSYTLQKDCCSGLCIYLAKIFNLLSLEDWLHSAYIVDFQSSKANTHTYCESCFMNIIIKLTLFKCRCLSTILAKIVGTNSKTQHEISVSNKRPPLRFQK